MKLTVLAVSLALACVVGQAEARNRQTAPSQPLYPFSQTFEACSDAIMHPCVGEQFAKNAKKSRRSVVSKIEITGCSDPIMKPCNGVSSLPRYTISRAGRAARTEWHRRAENRTGAHGARGAVIGGRPAGCPHRYCGCGASLYVFGRIIPALNLARNWLRFPRAAPASGMAAARSGHVFILKEHIKGLVWLVHDSNSGGGRTRVHPRSIAGFHIVNPHSSNWASAND